LVFRKISLRRGKSSALDVAQVSSARVAFASSASQMQGLNFTADHAAFYALIQAGALPASPGAIENAPSLY
jgi:hypothetical protein